MHEEIVLLEVCIGFFFAPQNLQVNFTIQRQMARVTFMEIYMNRQERFWNTKERQKARKKYNDIIKRYLDRKIGRQIDGWIARQIDRCQHFK